MQPSAPSATAGTVRRAPRGGVAWLLSARRGGLLALAAMLAVLPFFFPNNFYYDVAIKTALNAVVCIGLNLLIGYAGQISLGHAGFFALGAYASAILTTHYGWPGLVADARWRPRRGAARLPVARPILRLKGHYLAMATLGLGIIIAIVINREIPLTGGPDGMNGARAVAMGVAADRRQDLVLDFRRRAVHRRLGVAQPHRIADRARAACAARLRDRRGNDRHRHDALQGAGVRALGGDSPALPARCSRMPSVS